MTPRMPPRPVNEMTHETTTRPTAPWPEYIERGMFQSCAIQTDNTHTHDIEYIQCAAKVIPM